MDYIRTTKNACTVPTQNGYAELRKVIRIYNSAPELSADERIALAVKETGFAEKKVAELVAVGKACEYPIGIVPAEENESSADGTVSDELIEDRPYLCLRKCCAVFTVTIFAPLPIKSHLRINKFYLFLSAFALIVSAFSSPAPMRRLR